MKLYILGAIIGGISGGLFYPLKLILDANNQHLLAFIIYLPGFIAEYMGVGIFNSLIIIMIVGWAIVGAAIGYLLEMDEK
ncbi:MAG: hypothetical protein WA977_02860 [Halobacteriota archaeon]